MSGNDSTRVRVEAFGVPRLSHGDEAESLVAETPAPTEALADGPAVGLRAGVAMGLLGVMTSTIGNLEERRREDAERVRREDERRRQEEIRKKQVEADVMRLVNQAADRKRAAGEAYRKYLASNPPMHRMEDVAVRNAFFEALKAVGAAKIRCHQVSFRKESEVRPGQPALVAWDIVSNDYLGSRDCLDHLADADSGFSAIGEQLAKSVARRTVELREVAWERVATLAPLVDRLMAAENPRERQRMLDGIAMDSDARATLDQRRIQGLMVEAEILEAVGGDPVLVSDAKETAVAALEAADKSWLKVASCIQAAVVESNRSVGLNWVKGMAALPTGAPPTRWLIANNCSEDAGYADFSVRQEDIPWKITVNAAVGDAERIGRALGTLDVSDREPRIGAAAKYYRSRKFGGIGGNDVEMAISKAGWSKSSDVEAVALGVLEQPGRHAVAVIGLRDSSRAVFVPALMQHYAMFYGCADEVRVSPVDRGGGHLVTWYRGGEAVAHGMGTDALVGGFRLEKEAIMKAEQMKSEMAPV